MRNLHEHYDQLTPHEKCFLDTAWTMLARAANMEHIPLKGDDRAEVAVDAIARLIIQSRKPGELLAPWPVVEAAEEQGIAVDFLLAQSDHSKGTQ